MKLSKFLSKSKKAKEKHPSFVKQSSAQPDIEVLKPANRFNEGENFIQSRQRIAPKRNIYVPVVAIGASAGGLDSIKSFFQAMPCDPDMAFIIIQHLDPTHKSMLPELLQKYTQMQVFQIQNGLSIEANTVYVIPPNKYISVEKGVLHLLEPIDKRGMRMPVNYFFRALSDEMRESGIGIILSGTGSDGSLGVRCIKSKGGCVLIQEPSTAQFDGMPKSAIATGFADFIVPPDQMPSTLVNYVNFQKKQLFISDTTINEEITEELQPILELLRGQTKHDFDGYKKGTLSRRIQRRMALCQVNDISEYLNLLQKNSGEVDLLLRDLLIGVTAFFRDSDAWQALEEIVLTKLLAKHEDNNKVFRVWVPGCCTGEEAYTLAMLIMEAQKKLQTNHVVQIFASDIDEIALEVARSGKYSNRILSEISAERLKKFFTKKNGRFIINKNIREMILFTSQNIVSDPPFSRLDLICCRNLLIYLDAKTQQRIISVLHFSLNKGGYLFLGPSESISNHEDLFEIVSNKWRILRKLTLYHKGRLALSTMDHDFDIKTSQHQYVTRAAKSGSIKALAHEIFLREYVPPAVIINKQGEALYYHGEISKFLEISAGEPTRNVID